MGDEIDDDRVAALIKTVRRFLREERLHAERTEAETKAAGGHLGYGGPLTTTRDEADLWHAAVLNFTEADCDAALKRLARRRKAVR